ncbi:hypothetical protein AGMMS49944_19220 [Spirochaetia bacterium]|nr:hypothetical protein AGMMS49944_19220 [Spirochaetia bacterium]
MASKTVSGVNDTKIKVEFVCPKCKVGTLSGTKSIPKKTGYDTMPLGCNNPKCDTNYNIIIQSDSTGAQITVTAGGDEIADNDLKVQTF